MIYLDNAATSWPKPDTVLRAVMGVQQKPFGNPGRGGHRASLCAGRVVYACREEAAAFFGITLHAEKEILMMVVEKKIRDAVLNAIYKEMGMAKKAKGIVFSLPVSDVAGLAMPIDQEIQH